MSVRDARGFTLIEVLIAMIILSSGIVIIAVSWSGNFNRLQKARINNSLSFLLQRQMVETEAKYKDRMSELEDGKSGEFEDFPGYSWSMKAQPFEMPDLTGALASREGGVDQMLVTMLRTISDYIKQAVKEVTITVVYKQNSSAKTIAASATTYFIDYTKEPALGGAPAGAPAGSPKQ